MATARELILKLLPHFDNNKAVLARALYEEFGGGIYEYSGIRNRRSKADRNIIYQTMRRTNSSTWHNTIHRHLSGRSKHAKPETIDKLETMLLRYE